MGRWLTSVMCHSHIFGTPFHIPGVNFAVQGSAARRRKRMESCFLATAIALPAAKLWLLIFSQRCACSPFESWTYQKIVHGE
eukprot:1159821-Pelagomonas_calceolata.AAC.4